MTLLFFAFNIYIEVKENEKHWISFINSIPRNSYQAKCWFRVFPLLHLFSDFFFAIPSFQVEWKTRSDTELVQNAHLYVQFSISFTTVYWNCMHRKCRRCMNGLFFLFLSFSLLLLWTISQNDTKQAIIRDATIGCHHRSFASKFRLIFRRKMNKKMKRRNVEYDEMLFHTHNFVFLMAIAKCLRFGCVIASLYFCVFDHPFMRFLLHVEK